MQHPRAPPPPSASDAACTPRRGLCSRGLLHHHAAGAASSRQAAARAAAIAGAVEKLHGSWCTSTRVRHNLNFGDLGSTGMGVVSWYLRVLRSAPPAREERCGCWEPPLSGTGSSHPRERWQTKREQNIYTKGLRRPNTPQPANLQGVRGCATVQLYCKLCGAAKSRSAQEFPAKFRQRKHHSFLNPPCSPPGRL